MSAIQPEWLFFAIFLLFENNALILCIYLHQHCFLKKKKKKRKSPCFDVPLADGRLFWWEHDWIVLSCFCQSFSRTHEWRVIAPFLSLPFLVNKHRPRIRIIKILDYFCLPPFILSVNPPLHPSIPPSLLLLLLAIVSPSLRPAHLPGLPLPFCRTSGRYGVCRIACMHLNEKLHFVLLPSALLLTFIPLSFFFFQWLTLVLCCSEGATLLLSVQGNSGVLPQLGFRGQSLSLKLGHFV